MAAGDESSFVSIATKLVMSHDAVSIVLQKGQLYCKWLT